MRHPTTRTRLRSILLASAGLCLMLGAGGPARAGAPLARQDLGAIDPQAVMTAMVWLRPHDAVAFDALLAERTRPGSPAYHRWMSADEVAAFGPTEDDANHLAATLQAAGLRVSRPEGDRDVLRITGTAAVMQAVFKTEIRRFSQGGRVFHANIGEPHATFAHGELVAGITGLSSLPMMPFIARQRNPVTGEAVAPVPAAGVLNPYTVFTDACFRPSATVRLAQAVAGDYARYAGPKYTTRDLPSKQFTTCGYTPSQVAAQYGLPAVYAKGLRGQGQTIVIVDAYGSPTIQSDANVFSAMMGLPPLGAGNFQVVMSDGPPIASPYTTDWPLEISLDVEWAHAMAPMAKIVLVVAPSDDTSELAYAVHYAATRQLGDVMSNSYGVPEAGSGPEVARSFAGIIKQAAALGIAVNVSSGDSGDFGLGTPVGAASIPADAAFATAVGGTSLNVPSDIGPVDTAWGTNVTVLGSLTDSVAAPPEMEGFVQGGGGGESLYVAKPAWQAKAGLPGVGRQLPDVAALADPLTGGIIVADNGSGTAAVLLTIGGTSLASPIFSGIWALAQQASHERLGQAAPIIAAMPPGALTDILPVQATRSNLAGSVTQQGVVTLYDASDLLGLTATQPNGFVGVSGVFGRGTVDDLSFGSDSSLMAAPGWDNATGFGEPKGMAFIRAALAAGSGK